MSRRPIEGIDEKILLATIKVAGSTMEANRFSTKEIAAEAGCSEFVIYSHFLSKENLIAKTNAYVLRKYIEYAEKAVASSHNVLETFLYLLNEAVNMPRVTDFIVNYSHIFPRAKPLADYDGYKANMNVLCGVFAKAYPFGNENSELIRFLLMTHFMREMAVDAKLIIHHEIKDTPEIRMLMAKNAIFGLSEYAGK